MNPIKLTQIGNVQGNINTLPVQPQAKSAVKFQDILDKSISSPESVKFSAHAVERLSSRNIALSTDEVARLTNAVEKADAKGSRDSLVLMQDLAFVVNVKNKTVVTAMANSQLKDNVITNIDSTVFV